MLDFLPSRLVLLAVLVASVASAKDREPQIRNVLLPWRPDRLARLVYVAGEVATVLHFEKDVERALRTRGELAGSCPGRTPRDRLSPADEVPRPTTLCLQGHAILGLRSCRDRLRLYGRVWTGGSQVVIRYYAAHPPGGDKVPICAVARLAKGQPKKLPGSKPGMAILEFSVAGVYTVNEFR